MFYTLLNGSGDKSCEYGAFRETHSVRFFGFRYQVCCRPFADALYYLSVALICLQAVD